MRRQHRLNDPTIQDSITFFLNMNILLERIAIISFIFIRNFNSTISKCRPKYSQVTNLVPNNVLSAM